jgi:excinuclease ABC subunit B
VIGRKQEEKYFVERDQPDLAADPVLQYMSLDELEKTITGTRRKMEKAAKELDFLEAARLRDELAGLEGIRDTRNKK